MGNVLSLQWSEGSELPEQPFSTGQDKMHTRQVTFSEFRRMCSHDRCCSHPACAELIQPTPQGAKGT